MDAHRIVAHCFVMQAPRENGSIEPPLVAVVDDDESVRESLPDLLKELGFATRAFSSAREFLFSNCIGQTKCLILDVAMPDMTGLDLQLELRHRGHQIPVVFISGQKDETIREQALNQGAIRFLYKPFSDTALLDALNDAFAAN